MDTQLETSTGDYEFDAPSDVMDFKTLDKEDNADHWFDMVVEQGPTAMDQLITPLKTDKTPFGGLAKPDLPRAVVSPMMKAETLDTNSPSEDEQPSTSVAPSNLVTSWSHVPSAANQPQKKAHPAQPRRVSKRLSGQQKRENQRKTMAKIREDRRSNAPAAAVPAGIPPVKKARRNVSVTSLPRASAAVWRNKRSGSRVHAQQTATEPSTQADEIQSPKQKGYVRSTTPTVLKRSVSSTKAKSSEQQEMDTIQSLQKELAEHRKKNETSYKAAIAGSQPAKKIVLPRTVPVDFHFCTDERIKPHADQPSETSYKEVDFTSQLRKHPPSPAKSLKGHTIPKPFNLSCGTKRKFEESTYVSVAQQVEQFQKRTPARYHLRSRQREERGPTPVKNIKLKMTNPKTPQLMTRKRSRPVAVKSTAEIEAEELEKIQQFKFKALELNRKILDGGLLPKKPPVKEVTQAVGFNLEIEKRLQEREASKKSEVVEEYTFHSKPLPVKILEDVVGVPEKKSLPPTVPQSPAFALKNRVRLEPKVEEVKDAPVIKATPMPHFGLPFQPKPIENKQVEVCPFSFEAREKERQALKEKRLEELRHGEVPKFKAQPLPDFNEVHLPEKKVIEPTKAEPFKLLIDERGAMKTERWEQMMKEELRQQAEAASFKARPNIVAHKEPFVPKKENRAVLVSEGFQLSTERRAKERMEFDKTMAEKETQRAMKEEEMRRDKEEREKEEIARLRQDQVHKAQPVRRYKKVDLKKSDVILTVPESPNFSDRFRL
ncbi:targeting protein for Xklp2 isoform X2 [Amia ocellicauda]|uniref:targeting protein for Xklp2 isoform X2 n=1 Tax=Amia ocellicauda TaxID=2972642 RepID=UPI003464AD5B